MKRALRYAGAALALLLACGTFLTGLAAAENGPFEDVPEDAWYADEVLWCFEHGVMNGMGPSRFGPDAEMSRAMLVTVLYRAWDCPETDGAAEFSDVLPGAWYTDAVAWACECGAADGYGDGRFGVDDPVTREQAVTILWRLAGKPEAESDADFADKSEIADYALAAAAWARESGVVDGVGEGRFAPKEHMTRAQAAAVLCRYLAGEGGDAVEPGGSYVPAPPYIPGGPEGPTIPRDPTVSDEPPIPVPTLPAPPVERA